jgi:hypothetical protein
MPELTFRSFRDASSQRNDTRARARETIIVSLVLEHRGIPFSDVSLL